jgi:L-threonylcarbamoyladenylate synthase
MYDEIQKALHVLQTGGSILYPTDTVWGLGCDASNAQAVANIYRIKQRNDSKALIVLMADIAQLQQYVANIPPAALDILAKATRPTTIIYNQVQGNIAPNLMASDGSLAIRLPQHHFCQALLQALGKPIVSTSANLSGEPNPQRYSDISKQILEASDYVVSPALENSLSAAPSTILRLLPNGEISIIRA